MLNAIIRTALRHRIFIVATSAFLLVYGFLTVKQLALDVFPDLTKPTVTIMTEAHGRAPEEVEALVTLPLESVMGGIPGVERIRSVSGIGLSAIYIEFAWGQDIYLSRQLVNERLQLAKSRLPQDVLPTMGPVASLMGQIQQVALSTRDDSLSPVELRSLAEWVIRPRLLSIPGVAQVIPIGGGLRQYQIFISAEKMNRYQITLEDLNTILPMISQNSPGGFIDEGDFEVLVRNIGSVANLDDIRETAVGLHFGRPILLRDIAEVREGTRLKRGEGSYMGQPAVILTIQKQPGADTLKITQEVERALAELQDSLPPALLVNPNVFKQANFIQASIDGIIGKLQLGSVLVFLVLLIFLANLRMSLVSITAIPLSFIITFIVLRIFGLSINTMTLGGLAIAIGELVDDSIVDVENIYRRVRENYRLSQPQPLLKVIYAASSEVRNSIVLATVIIALVFLPLFNLSGLEGRLFTPLAFSYLTALMASLVISLTVTPVLCSYLLRIGKLPKHDDSWLLGILKRIDRRLLQVLLPRTYLVFIPTLLLLILAVALIPRMGREFLPKFNEGTAMIAVFAAPGTSLKASDRIGLAAELEIMKTPEIISVSRRTGRAEQDEHAMAVNISEIDVDFQADMKRSRDEVLDDIRKRVETIEGVQGVNVGQPLSHLIDHMLSGVSSQIAIKLFGPDLQTLRAKAAEIKRKIQDVPGLVDLRVEQQALIPQLKIYIMRQEAANYGLTPGELTELLEVAFNGEIIAQVLEGQRVIDVFFRFDDKSRGSLEKMAETIVKIMPDGQKIRVADIADLYKTEGPNEIYRENAQRRIVISANVIDRDLAQAVEDIQDIVDDQVKLPNEYFLSYGGQFEAEQRASERILLLGFLSMIGIAIVLYSHFHSLTLTLQVMLTIPLAFIGGIIAIYLGDKTITVASLIGFITLAGVASRNAIMMISHYLHLMRFEQESFSKEMIIRGSLERLSPVLMTATVTVLALLPLVFAKGQTGSEILHPVALVIVGGLISSTLLDIFVTPALFYLFAEKTSARYLLREQKETAL
ncbi:MAG: efflux RND transporter permease subunit [Oligoflexus sp.]